MKIIKTSEALPKSGRYVLAWLEGAKIPMRAMWAAQHTLPLGDDADPEWGEYSEEKDEYFCPAGWYEMNQFEEQHWGVSGNVVAWCELPRLDHQCLAQIEEPAQPVLYVSPGQLANHSNPEGPESEKAGRYLPARKTPAGKFIQPLYAGAAPAAVAGSSDERAAVLDAARDLIELRDEYAQKTQNAMPGNEYWSERFDAKYQALAAALAAASALEAPAAGAPQGEYPHEQMDAMALDRYKVVPSNASMLWSHAVVAGDGTQQLYVGREVECQNMARKFAGAFLDGAFAFHSTAAAPTAQAAPALEAPAGPATSAQAQALHRARRALHAIGKTYDDSELRTRALEADEEIDRMLAAAPPAPAARVDDLAALVKKLVQALRKAAPNHVLPAQALDYLKRQGLQGSPLRAAEAAPQAPAAPGMAVTALAGEIIAALEADEKDGGYDLTSGLFGPKFSALVRRWAASEWAHVTAPQAPAAPVLVGDEQADAYLTDPGRLESLARSHPAGLVRALARAALAAAPQAPAVPVAVTTRAELEKLQGGAGSMATIFPADASGFPVRLYAEPAAPAVDAALNALIADVRALPTLRASEIDGEESDGTPKHWRNRPFVSLRKLELLLRDRVTASSDTALLNFIAAEYLDLRSFGMPTGQGDADVGWRVIQHHMGEPTERVVAEVYKDDPRSAIRAAIARLERDPYCTGALHEEDAAQAKEGGKA